MHARPAQQGGEPSRGQQHLAATAAWWCPLESWRQRQLPRTAAPPPPRPPLQIDLAEFVAAVLGQSYTQREEFVRALFTKFDADSSGFVSAGGWVGAFLSAGALPSPG